MFFILAFADSIQMVEMTNGRTNTRRRRAVTDVTAFRVTSCEFRGERSTICFTEEEQSGDCLHSLDLELGGK